LPKLKGEQTEEKKKKVKHSIVRVGKETEVKRKLIKKNSN